MVRLDNEIKVWFFLDDDCKNADAEHDAFVDYVEKIILNMPIPERGQYAWDYDDTEHLSMYIQAENMPKVKKWVEEFNAQYKDDISPLPFYVDDAGQYIVNSKLMAKAIDRMTDEQFCGQLWWQAAGCGQYIVPFDYGILKNLTVDVVKEWWENGFHDECMGTIENRAMHFFISDVMIDDGSKDSSLEHHKSIPATLIAIHQAIADGRLHEDDTYITTRFNEDDKIFGAKSPKELARIAYPELYHELFEQDGVCHIWGDVVDGIDFDALLKDDIVLTDEQKATGDELFLDVPKDDDTNPYGYDVDLYDDDDIDSYVGCEHFNKYDDAKEYAQKTVDTTNNIISVDIYPATADGNRGERLFTYTKNKKVLGLTNEELKLIKDVLEVQYEFYSDDKEYQTEAELCKIIFAKMQALENINNG